MAEEIKKVNAPPHIPTDETRKQVADAAGRGSIQTLIASELGINVKTLRAHYRFELDHGMDMERDWAVGQLRRCAARALEDPRYQASLIFLLKSKHGFSERGQDMKDIEGVVKEVYRFRSPDSKRGLQKLASDGVAEEAIDLNEWERVSPKPVVP